MHAVAILKELRRTYKHLSSLERDALKCAIAVRSSYWIDIEESTLKKNPAVILVPNPWYMYSILCIAIVLIITLKLKKWLMY